jgi:hypothetical protein
MGILPMSDFLDARRLLHTGKMPVPHFQLADSSAGESRLSLPPYLTAGLLPRLPSGW